MVGYLLRKINSCKVSNLQQWKLPKKAKVCYVIICLQYIPWFPSDSEYLVRNWVRAAYQQDVILQGLKCVLFKFPVCIVQGEPNVLYRVYSVYCTRCGVCIEQVCSVYCTRCAYCIVQGVECALHRVISLYSTQKSSVSKEDFDIKSDLILY